MASSLQFPPCCHLGQSQLRLSFFLFGAESPGNVYKKSTFPVLSWLADSSVLDAANLGAERLELADQIVITSVDVVQAAHGGGPFSH
jgi:hypothetical protein